MVVRGSIIYAILSKNSGEKGLVIFDASYPKNIELVGGYNSSITDSSSYYNSIAIQNSLLYIGVYGYGIQVIDVCDFSKPRLIGEYNETNFHSSSDIEVLGPLVITAGSSYIAFLDVSDFSNITILGKAPLNQYIHQITIQGNKMYATVAWEGVNVYELDFNPITEITTEITTEEIYSTITEQYTENYTSLIIDTTVVTQTTEITHQKSEVSFNSLLLFGAPMLISFAIIRRKTKS